MTTPLTPAERKALRRKSLWRVADLARYMGESQQVARRVLQRYNAALGGMLLRPSKGRCRVYTFLWRPLAAHDPGMFLDDPLDAQAKLDEVEDIARATQQAQRMIANQVGENSRDISRLKQLFKRAA